MHVDVVVPGEGTVLRAAEVVRFRGATIGDVRLSRDAAVKALARLATGCRRRADGHLVWAGPRGKIAVRGRVRIGSSEVGLSIVSAGDAIAVLVLGSATAQATRPCPTPGCVDPAHREAVETAPAIDDGMIEVTEWIGPLCPQGHDISGGGIAWLDGRGRRRCRRCNREGEIRRGRARRRPDEPE